MNKSLTGFMWKLLEHFGVSGVQFVLQIILARILSPEHYGVLSIMNIFIALATVFIQTGFNTALIQRKEIKEEDYSSVLWVSWIIAGGMYIAIYFCAPLIGEFYNIPEVVAPLRVLALMLFPGALNSVQLAKVSREMDFKKIFFSSIGGAVFSGVVGIIIAYMGGGLWALVVQSLINILTTSLIMYFTVKLRIRFACNFRRIKELFSFGWKLLVSSIVETLYQDIRSLVIGKKYNSSTLAYYNRGKNFPQYIINAVNGALKSVLLPSLSQKQDAIIEVKAFMRKSITLSSYILFPMMTGLAAVSPPLVSLLLTDKWLPCVPYMQIYCFTLAFYPVHSCNLQTINALGRSDIFLKLEIIKKVYGIAALVIAVIFFDSPIAIAMTGLITTFISCFVNASPSKKLFDYSYFEQMRDILPSFILSLVMFVIVLCVGKIGLGNLLTLILQIAVGAVFYIVSSHILKLKPYIQTLDIIKGILHKKTRKM